MGKASKLLILLMFLTIQGIGQIQQHGMLYRHVQGGEFQFTQWVSNSTIISGLSDVGSQSSPTVFEIDGETYLITTNSAGSFFGYIWNGSGWTSNSAIIDGLSTSLTFIKPTSYYYNNTNYFMYGSQDGKFYGREWKYLSFLSKWTWSSTTVIDDGLPDVGTYSSPEMFEIGSSFYLVSSNVTLGTFLGYIWNGSGWTSNSAIVNGLYINDYRGKAEVFQINGTTYLISGASSGVFYGFEWNGSSWVSNTTIISNLVDVGSQSSPAVFWLEGNLYLISGEGDGVFNGWIAE